MVRCNPTYNWKQPIEYEGGLGFTCLIQDGDRNDMELWAAEQRKVVVDMGAVGKALEYPQPMGGVLQQRCSIHDGGGWRRVLQPSKLQF